MFTKSINHASWAAEGLFEGLTPLGNLHIFYSIFGLYASPKAECAYGFVEQYYMLRGLLA
jgi:hypothetical protein